MKTIKITVLLTLLMSMTSVKTLAQSGEGENADGTPVIYATIDDEKHGSSADDPINLNDYFRNNPIYGDLDLPEVNYNLLPNKFYTIIAPLTFYTPKGIMLRSADETQQVNLTIGEDASFVVAGSFTLERLNITYGSSREPLIVLSGMPYEELKYVNPETQAEGAYILDHISINRCNISGLISNLLHAKDLFYCVANMNIENTILELNTDQSAIKNDALICLCNAYNGFSGVKDFKITKSTIYQTGTGDAKYFLRYGNNARIDRWGPWNREDYHTTITYDHNTFYKVLNNREDAQWSNYVGITNYTIYNISNNIWYDCADGDIARRILGNGRLGTNASASWNLNTYYWSEGEIYHSSYDTSGNYFISDPNFKDPANGDFTPQNGDQVNNKTGDPRWLAGSTGIQAIKQKNDYENTIIYNLQGVRISKATTKGLYIVNGRKVVIK